MIDFQIKEASENTKYEQVKNSIAEAIRNGKFAPLSKLPPISQIAKDAKVSLKTADLALQALIAEGFCFRRPKKGTFVAVGKRVQKRPVCGMLGHVDPINYSIQSLLYANIMDSSIRKNVPTLTFPYLTGEKGLGIPAEMIRDCDKSSEYDLLGIFILDSDHYLYGVELAKAFPDIRFFLLNYERNDFSDMPANMAAVINDNYGGAYRLAECIAERYQPKTVTCITSPLKEHDITYQERERGLSALAKDRGIKLTQTVTVPRSSYLLDQIDFAYEAFQKFLKSKKTDFVFSVNDHFAIGAKKAIDELGLGEEIKIVGNGGFFSQQEGFSAIAKTQYKEICTTGLQGMLNPEFKMPQVLKIQPEIILFD